MSAAPERREPIDIDEFERRLLTPEPTRRVEDPLVELARLLSQQQQQAADPIAHFFAENRGSGNVYPAPLAVPDPAAPPAEAFADFPDLRPLLRGGVEPPSAIRLAPAPEAPHFEAGAPAPEVYAEPPAPSVQYEDWAEVPELAPDVAALDPPRQRSRKPLYIAGAVIAAGFLAIGSTLAWRGGAHQAGGVATIAASTAPTKIAPKENESADKAPRESTMLERTAAPPVKKVVSREEQPIDVSTAARTPRVIPLDDSGSANTASTTGSTSAAIAPPPPPQREPTQARSAFPEPKRVKTVSVRADGSIIGADAAQPPAAQAPKPPERATPAPARNATPKTAARADATTTAGASKLPVAPKPKAEAKPAPKPQRVAAAPPAESRAAEPAEDAAPAPVASGGYSLQIASAGSDAEARQTASRLGAKFSGALGGRRPAVIKASDTLYRVRVTGLSKESAAAMCGKVKAAGGACFVAR